MGDSLLAAANAAAAIVKVLVGVMALALVQPWGLRLPRRPLLVAAWAAAIGLSAYGALQTGAVALLASGVIEPAEPVEARVLRWRLFLWEPWFLLIGLLLAGAAMHYKSSTASSRS